MPIDPSLITDTLSRWQSPQFAFPDPLAQFAKLQALQNGITQQQVNQQQLQAGALGLQEKQTLLNDQQKLSQLQADPSLANDPDPLGTVLKKAAGAGVSFNTINTLTKAHLENSASIANTQKAQADAAEANNKVAESQGNLVSDMLKSSQDQGSTAASLLAHANLLKTVSPALGPKLDALTAQVLNAPDPDAAAKKLIESGINQATMAKAAQAAQHSAAAKKDTAEATKTEFQNTLMKTALDGGAGAGESLIQQRFAGNPAAAAKALFAWRQNLSTGDLKAANDEVNKIYQNEIGAASQIASETPAKVAQGRAMIPVEAATAAARERAALPVRQAEASYQNALQQGDKASADYYNSLTTAKKALATASTIQSVLDLSKQTDNPVAMQQLKAMVPEFTNAAQDIKRLSGGQNAGLSSALDNAINELSSAGGKPLSDATMQAIAPYVKTIANGAVAQHNANVQALATAYPQKKFAPEPAPYEHVGGHFVGEVVPLKSGQKVTITKILPNNQFEYK